MTDQPYVDDEGVMVSFPEGGMAVKQIALSGPCHEGYGMLISQDAESLHDICIDMFVGKTPREGFLRMRISADDAEIFAQHLLALAPFAREGKRSVE
ncbi:hypothetical protein SEA_VASUNZINGA_14 [Mycobacterium phage VasuNzinga]|uniref:Uncharacterized protein n=1 Tax=Mycobacterium phage VasuNzinga TaxID=2301620 RepID=A0A385UFW9_9CAUD|nr:hypothetical protein SEA_VASUNZINGA_14 [Mycobacterium phage VasuNzinga]